MADGKPWHEVSLTDEVLEWFNTNPVLRGLQEYIVSSRDLQESNLRRLFDSQGIKKNTKKERRAFLGDMMGKCRTIFFTKNGEMG